MGNRISKVVTKTGDDGTTGLANGSRVSKGELRVELIGLIDHLNSVIGTVYCHNIGFGYGQYNVPENIEECLIEVQHKLFDIGGQVSYPDSPSKITDEDILVLENYIQDFNKDLEPLKEFVLPSGVYSATQCHVARTTCRSAERLYWRIDKYGSDNSKIYLNRLSDLLFIIARHLNKVYRKKETTWRKLTS